MTFVYSPRWKRRSTLRHTISVYNCAIFRPRKQINRLTGTCSALGRKSIALFEIFYSIVITTQKSRDQPLYMTVYDARLRSKSKRKDVSCWLPAAFNSWLTATWQLLHGNTSKANSFLVHFFSTKNGRSYVSVSIIAWRLARKLLCAPQMCTHMVDVIVIRRGRYLTRILTRILLTLADAEA